MSRRNTAVTTASRKVSEYVCPTCRFNQTRTIHTTVLATPKRSIKPRYSSSSRSPSSIELVRSVSTSKPARATEASINTSRHSASEYTFSLKPGVLKSTASNSTIRDSLRSWSVQNQAEKEKNTPDSLTLDGRITQLPSNLFLNRRSEDVDETPDQDSLAFKEDEEVADSALITPGSLFSHKSSNSDRVYAVYLGNIGVQSLLVLETGRWSLERITTKRKHASGSNRLIVPNFLQVDDVESIKAHMPKASAMRPTAGDDIGTDVDVSGPLPPQVAQLFMDRIRQFKAEVLEFEQNHGRELDAAWEEIAHETEWRFITLKEYVAKSIGLDWDRMSDGAKMATVNCVNDVDHIKCLNTAETLTLLLCSKTLRENVKTVMKWTREYQDAAAQAALGRNVTGLLQNNPLTAFIEKARRLILKSRRLRAPTTIGCLGPCSPQSGMSTSRLKKAPTGEEFSQSDKLIIDFIWNAVCRQPAPLFQGPWKMVPITSMILRAVGAYPSLNLDPKAGRLFLKEIGSLDPWSTKYTTDLQVPLPGGRASHRSDLLNEELQCLAVEFDRNRGGDGTSLVPDTMAHLRRDWGNMEALVIDPSSAEILEDAISVEPATEVSGGHWIHVHTSHITAFFGPESIISRYSRNQGSACFSVDGTLPIGMIPKNIASHFSLQKGSPVLTFSTLLTEDGCVHDTKISAGILRNVRRISRDIIDPVLGINQKQNLAIVAVGKSKYVSPPALDKEDIKRASVHKGKLQLLQKLLGARWAQRKAEMPEEVAILRNDLSANVSATMLKELRSPNREHASYHWQGDPGIILSAGRTVERSTTDRSREDDIITQSMRLAGESAGRWLSERKIPAVFLRTETVPDNSIEQIRQAKSGTRVIKPLFVRSSVPGPYWNLDIKAYVSCSSPLRRYFDMLLHYQVDSYLKAEAAGNIWPGTPVEDDSLLAFTKAEVDEYLSADAHASETIATVTRFGKLDYAFQAMFRAFHFKESKLPDVWEILISEPAKVTASGYEQPAQGALIPFGLSCTVRSSPEGWERQAAYDRFLPVKIAMVDPDEHIIHVVPVGPPTMTQMIHDPIQAWSEANVEQ